MKDTKEIVLFFKEKAEFNSIDIAHELSSRYPELGNVMILPDNQNNTSPIIVFNTNPDIQIQVNKVNLNLVVNHVYFDKLSTIIFDLVDIFEDAKQPFFRVGYISNNFLSDDDGNLVMDKYLKLDNLTDFTDFNLGWYKKLELKDKSKINSWQRFIRSTLDFQGLLVQFDFNTPVSDDVDFNMKYIKEFMRVCEEYIESKLND